LHDVYVRNKRAGRARRVEPAVDIDAECRRRSKVRP
jgi:hypothetical protein